MMKETNKHNLEKAIQQLPDIVSNKEGLWQKIKENLLFDNMYCEKNRETLLSSIRELPEIKPQKDIWTEIENRKSSKTGLKLSVHRYKNIISGIVASILICTSILYFTRNHDESDIVFSKEISTTTNYKTETIDAKSIKNKISKLCKKKPVGCQNKDFIELKNKLDLLIIEKEQLKEEELFNIDPSIKKYQLLIDEQIKNIENQIINYLSS